jgi:DNA invertase Pin-like site-specific DNA recombinase
MTVGQISVRSLEWREAVQDLVTYQPGRRGRRFDDPNGKLVIGILALTSEFETAIRRERQMEGVARAKAEGRTGGRPKLVTDDIATDIRARRAGGEAFVQSPGTAVSVWRRCRMC